MLLTMVPVSSIDERVLILDIKSQYETCEFIPERILNSGHCPKFVLDIINNIDILSKHLHERLKYDYEYLTLIY
jgi:hypothetical protein